MKYLILLLCVFIAACEDTQTTDQCMRAELFKQCLAAVPASPQITHENPWSKVVAECDDAARSQSYRNRKSVVLECRAY